MNDHEPHDQRWNEPVSLLAAGCLEPDQEAAVREHLKMCPSCQQRFRQLAALCAGLHAARAAGPELSSQIAERARCEIRAPQPRRKLHRATWNWGIAAAIAASLIVAITLRSFWSPRRQTADTARQPAPATVRVNGTFPVANHESHRPPTLLAYERSCAQSNQAVDSLLDQEARRLAFLSDSAPTTLMNELGP